MYKTAIKAIVKRKFSYADVHLNGNRPWDIQVYNDQFFPNVLFQGSLGLGESFMEGWIDSAQLDEAIYRIVQKKISEANSLTSLMTSLGAFFLNRQSKKRALDVGRQHYDLSNVLFQRMLDSRMTYSCAYWKDANNLDDAQVAKLDLVCKKLYLQPGMRVLDIGCGWGSFAKFAAERYGVKVVGITISHQQLDLAKKLCKGLPIELRFQDYRDVNESFDRIVSIGQMEHVGYKNYKAYMKMAHRCLPDHGLFLLHTIGNNASVYSTDPWIDKYIFPNGMLPSIAQLARSSEKCFVMEDWHNFGADYDKTLMAWFNNFNDHWLELKGSYDERFYRMWKFYLLGCAAAFRARNIQLWQVVFSKNGIPGGYTSIR